MKYYHIFFIIFFVFNNVNLDQVNAIRCAQRCWFGPVEPGSKHPFTVPCDTIEIDPQATECTVTIALRLSDSSLIGIVNTRSRITNMSATLTTLLDFNVHSTVSMINYTCSTTDDCDQEFVLQSVGSSKWSQLNVTKTREKVVALLIDEGFTVKNFTCAHNVTCQSFYENCQANYIEQSLSPYANTTNFNNNYKCIINHLTEIAIIDYYTFPDRNHTTVTEVMCNKDHCNERETVHQALDIIQNEFTLPLNYSQFMPND